MSAGISTSVMPGTGPHQAATAGDDRLDGVFAHPIGHADERRGARDDPALQVGPVATAAVLLIRDESGLQRTPAAPALRNRAGLDVFETEDRHLIDVDDEHQSLLRIGGGRGPVRSPLIARHRDGVDERGRREQALVARLGDALLHRGVLLRRPQPGIDVVHRERQPGERRGPGRERLRRPCLLARGRRSSVPAALQSARAARPSRG